MNSSNISRFIMIGAIVAIVFSTLLLKRLRKPTTTTYTIGILQTASHPALDAVKKGFKEEALLIFNNDISFVDRNIEGNIAQAQTIAQQFHADNKINGILAIATPTAQAIATVEKQKPIFIGAVTDPNALGFVSPKTNVTGTSDMIDVSGEIQALAALLPSVKKVAVIFNPAEINSLTQSKKMIDELIKRNIEPIEIGIQSETDIPAALNNALRKADALLAPTDNLVASAIALIANQARIAKKPLIVSDNLLVTHGALMARGIDYEESGRQTARIAHDVLVNKQEPAQIPVVPTQTNTVFINKKVMHDLSITIPESMKDSVKIVK